jgi:gliding motility-associated-like protein
MAFSLAVVSGRLINMFARFLLFLHMAFLPEFIAAQAVNPYHMNGSAIQENCNCYTITPDVLNVSGSVWNVNKIDLRNSFDYKFDVFLGCEDSRGADGIVFVLQPISVSIGSTGGGLGFEGVNPSIGIAIDTWQNSINQDPSEDHIAIHKNGDLNHSSVNNLAGPVSALAGNGNIEDCNTHSLRIIWNASTKSLRAQIDGVERVETTIDLVKDVFNNEPMVFWGFTGSTGSAKNLQRFCTSLNAAFTLPSDLSTCLAATIPFTDSSTSFGNIVKWAWDFGDGTTSSSPSPAPHPYTTPGNYDVKLSIVGNNGCASDTFRQRIVIGSKPVADFVLDPDIVCDSSPVVFIDKSRVEFGTINKWEWNIDGGLYNSRSPDSVTFNNTGSRNASLVVTTKEGCIADPVIKTFQVLKRPQISFGFTDVCLTDPVVFNATTLNTTVNIGRWNWSFGDGTGQANGATTSHQYVAAGKYQASVYATSTEGCLSPLLTGTVTVWSTKANAGPDTILAVGQPYQLKGSGGDLYRWSPSNGISDPNISNPIVTLEQDARITLTASTTFGCPTTDVINIKVYKGPEIYVPNAFTPNADGKNDRFRPVVVGMSEVMYFRIYNRYGQLIFSSRDTFLGWDGSTNGKAQPSGTYVWQVAGVDFAGQQHVKKGTVTLVR